MNPDTPFLLAQEILGCICAALDSDSECLCPCNKFVAHGQVTYDFCCPGQLWVAVDRLFVYDNFPQASSGPVTCTPALGAEMSVGLLRCAPTLNEAGKPPTAEQLDAASQTALREGMIVLSSLICCLIENGPRARRFSIGGQSPLSGGCLGSITRFSVELRINEVAS